MGLYTTDDVTNLEQWAVDSRAARNSPEMRVEEPDISRNLKVFLRVMLNPQWKAALCVGALVTGGPAWTTEGLPG